jgi:hypothetical protein
MAIHRTGHGKSGSRRSEDLAQRRQNCRGFGLTKSIDSRPTIRPGPFFMRSGRSSPGRL